jgi:hypothetical protein
VKYQDQNQSSDDYENGSFSTLALKRWLQVTIPLTALTLFGAWSTYRFYDVTARQMTFVPRLKRALLHLTPSEASSYVQTQHGDLSGNSNVTNKGRIKRLGVSISRFISNFRSSGKTGPTLPQHNGSPAKHG